MEPCTRCGWEGHDSKVCDELIELRAKADILARVDQTILRIEDPKILKGDRTTDDWLAQILQVFVIERDIALKEIDILIARANELRAKQTLP